MLLNENLMSQQMNTTITATIELEEVACSSTVKPFTALVYVEFDLLGNLLPSPEEVQSLKESFVITYNSLSFERCDPNFRKITQASLSFRLDADDYEEDEMYPAFRATAVSNTSLPRSITSNETFPGNMTFNETATTGKPRPKTQKSAVFTIHGECRGCPVDKAGWFTLFSNDGAFHQREDQRYLAKEGREEEIFSTKIDSEHRSLLVHPPLLLDPPLLDPLLPHFVLWTHTVSVA